MVFGWFILQIHNLLPHDIWFDLIDPICLILTHWGAKAGVDIVNKVRSSSDILSKNKTKWYRLNQTLMSNYWSPWLHWSLLLKPSLAIPLLLNAVGFGEFESWWNSLYLVHQRQSLQVVVNNLSVLLALEHQLWHFILAIKDLLDLFQQRLRIWKI